MGNTLAIITINLNNSKGLEKTIQSIIGQKFNDYEYLVIDGASIDGSVELIKSYSQYITKWLSEPDSGIYNAMNKGIQMATSDYCLFLNSGDWLADKNTLQNVFETNPTSDIIAGDIYFFDTDLGEIKWHVCSPSEVTAKNLFNNTLPHQATFIKRNLFDKYGFYNESLQIASDWQFFLEIILEHGASYSHYNGVISYFNMDGISCKPATTDLARQEQLAILENKYPRFIADYNLLEKLEKENQEWYESKEYKVFRFLLKNQIIGIGVFIIRILNYSYRALHIKKRI
jgi:glycosyltransferase involved in cell wall biosynthesis